MMTHNSKTHDLLPPALVSSPTFAPLLRFLSDIDDRLELTHHAHSHTQRSFSPRFDLLELPAQYELYGDLPGVCKEDVIVDLKEKERILVVKGNRGDCSIKGEGTEGADGTVIIGERGTGAFERRFKLPDEVRREGVKASLEEGVLRVVVPRVGGEREEEGCRVEIL